MSTIEISIAVTASTTPSSANEGGFTTNYTFNRSVETYIALLPTGEASQTMVGLQCCVFIFSGRPGLWQVFLCFLFYADHSTLDT